MNKLFFFIFQFVLSRWLNPFINKLSFPIQIEKENHTKQLIPSKKSLGSCEYSLFITGGKI